MAGKQIIYHEGKTRKKVRDIRRSPKKMLPEQETNEMLIRRQ